MAPSPGGLPLVQPPLRGCPLHHGVRGQAGGQGSHHLHRRQVQTGLDQLPHRCTVQYSTVQALIADSTVKYSSYSSLFHKFSAATELPDYWILPIPPGSPASTQGARSHAWVILLTTLITKTNIHVSKLFHLSKQFVNFIV